MSNQSTEKQLTWKRVTRNGRTYWHLFNADGTEARPIIGIEGQLIEEVERLLSMGKELSDLLAEARNERDMYKQQRADWKAAYDGLLEQREYEANPPVRQEDIR